MDEKKLSELRKLYAEIIQGHTKALFNHSRIAIKHFTAIDQGIIDSEYSFFYDKAVNEGLLNNEQRLQLLLDQGLWSKEDESAINRHKKYIADLYVTKSKVPWLSEVEAISKTIEAAELELAEKLQKKKSLIGFTAESFATRKLNEKYIFHSFRKTEDIKEHYFESDVFEDMESSELEALILLYNKYVDPFNTRVLKEIGLAFFFQQVYGICDDNPHVFYGKPVCDLTYYQTEIFTYGRFFKSILGMETKAPKDIEDDPDKLIDWYMSLKNSKDFVSDVDDNVNGATTLFGVKKSDITAAGGRVAKSPVEKAIQQGKAGMEMTDLLKFYKV